MRSRQHRVRQAMARFAVGVLAVVAVGVGSERPIEAQDYQRISGEGSSWSANAIDAMRVNVEQFGITVNYNPTGSTVGRKNFLNGTVDFAVSDIPFQFTPEDGSAPENPAPGSYAYMPVTAGGTAFMYNLKINGQQVTNLRLSGENVAKIFTGAITTWNDPAIQADNPGLTLPARGIVPVVRAEGTGLTQQFTAWMIARHGAVWQAYCERSGRAPACGATSFYPTISGMISQNGDLGVSGYVSQGFAEGAIGYVNYSYALGAQFPVVKMLNAAGYYTEPTPENVAVSLLKAGINTDESNPATYLTQQLQGVYTNTDPRNYELSSYSYLILPTKLGGTFSEAKGRTLGAFAYYAMCQAQQQSASLGYAPMPINLVQASFEQIAKIPGVVVQDIDISTCNNPTFSPDGGNVLAERAPQPKACDKQGPLQCPDGTGGRSNQPTPVLPPPPAGSTSQGVVVKKQAGALLLTQQCGAFGRLPRVVDVDAGELPALDEVTPAAIGGTANCTIDLGTATLVSSGSREGRYYVATGRINQLTVTDTRSADRSWVVTMSVTRFGNGGTGANDSFSGNLLGWRPVVSSTSGDRRQVSAGPAVEPSPTDEPRPSALATAFPGGAVGTTRLDARLKLLIPAGVTDGTFSATLTFTVI